MAIPHVDVKAQYAPLIPELKEAFARTLESGRFIFGPEVESFERDYLTALLARHRGNISRAASEAGIDRNYIHRLVKKYGLEVDRG